MIKTYFVDSFTTEPFKGNPAGVCMLNDELSDETMLKIAREIGFSETAFVKKIMMLILIASGTFHQKKKFLYAVMQHLHLLKYYLKKLLQPALIL